MAKSGPKPRPPEERFWPKVRKTETCWLWTAGVNKAGYGAFFAAGKSINAHRYAYELLVGPIPEGLQLDHLCRVVVCVNPAHLEPVTGQVNCMRGEGFAAQNALKTHCPQGHPYDEANTYIHPSDGRRVCRTCNRESSRRYRAKRKAEAWSSGSSSYITAPMVSSGR